MMNSLVPPERPLCEPPFCLFGGSHSRDQYRTGGFLLRIRATGELRWLGPEDGGLLCFAREPGFILAANLGAAPVPLPAHREVLLTSGPLTGGSLPPDTAAWLCT